MIVKTPADLFRSMCDLIGDLHRKVGVEDAGVEAAAEVIYAATKKLERPRVIDGGKQD